MDESRVGPEPASAGPSGTQATEAVDHLRAAAHELIGAVRGFLDVAEELVDDPKAGEALVDTVASFAQAARRGASSVGRDDPGDDYEHIDLGD
jgi:hypothetical protein